MWWPRPRWKSDFLARFIFLVSITVATTTNVVMADEGQHCGGNDMSAVIWTTALCTMLLILIIVVIYFLYCKKREHDWSSLWWKSNSDKNIVLQTSPPANGQNKIGGTDNPAFLADSNVVDRVTKTGSTKVVHVSSLNDGSLGAELSFIDEDGRKIFLCEHNDGSKDQLVSVRLVFDKGQQQLCGPSSDLSRALAELSREYGFQVELETKGRGIAAGSPAANENDVGTEKRMARPDILSAVRGTALRLWQQRPLVFKGGDDGSRADDKNNCGSGGDDDVESGRGASVTDAPIRSEQQKSATCVVTTVDETAFAAAASQQQPSINCNGGGSLQYRTLEYGASPADMTSRSSPDSSIQCCVVNSSGPVTTVTSTEVKANKDATAYKDTAAIYKDTAAVNKDIVAVNKETAADNKDTAAEKVCAKIIDGNSDEPTEPTQEKDDESKHANPPPPPPPRKYSSSVQVSAVQATVSAGSATPPASHTAIITKAAAVHVDPLPVVSVAPTKTAPPTAINEIRIDDDYYWCTTTAMAAPPMSTFGKRQSVTASGGDGDAPPQDVLPNSSSAVVTAVRGDVNAAVPVEKSVADDKSAAAVVRVDDDDDRDKTATADGVDADGDGGRDIVAASGGGTTSIEDASLPSFSSDEDEEEEDDDDDDDDATAATHAEPRGNGAFATGKTQFSGSPVATPRDVTRPRSVGGGDSEIAVAAAMAADDGRKGRKLDPKAGCNGELRNNDYGVAAAVDPKSPTKLPTLRLSLSSPLQSSATTTTCCSSSASSTSSTSSSPTNNGSGNNNNINNNNSPIVSKIPVRRQSAGSSSIISNGGTAVSMSLTNNGSAKKSIPLPLSRSGSRLAMWSSVN